MHKSERLRGLYVLTNEVLLPDESIVEAVAAAIAGGCRVVQYRDKTSTAQRRLQQARELQTLCRRTQTVFIVNDDIELAQACHADGVHLGRDDADPAQARAVLGQQSIIGISCYNDLALARKAAQAGADYIAFGSFFSSNVKPDAVHADTGLLRTAASELHIPITAIGGIDSNNAGALIEAGADMLAVISSVFAAADIRAAASSLSALFGSD